MVTSTHLASTLDLKYYLPTMFEPVVFDHYLGNVLYTICFD